MPTTNKKRKIKKLKAYTLNELLVVLIIIGILILLALPNLMPLISKAKSTGAGLQLRYPAVLLSAPLKVRI